MEQPEWETKINRAAELSDALWVHSDEVLLGDPLVEEAAELLDELAKMLHQERLRADDRVDGLRRGIRQLFERDQGR